LLTLVLVVAFSGVALFLLPEEMGMVGPGEAAWWTITHFLDGGTVAGDSAPRRLLGLVVTGIGILVISLLTAFLSSKMGERISDLRSGLNKVVERHHVLCLGYDANVPVLARELARSGQRVTLVVLSPEPKDKVEAGLRVAHRVPGAHLRTIVRTGDPRLELSLLRVAAHHARKVVVVPPSSLDDEGSVRWTLATLLALRRVVGGHHRGGVLALARHLEAVELLTLAAEPDEGSTQGLSVEVVATDAVVAAILAQSTREDGVYHVLRRLLAFDGCELYTEPVPPALVGRSFDDAHAALAGGVLVGVRRSDGLDLAPRHPVVLASRDELIVMRSSRGTTLEGTLPPAPALDPHSIPPPRGEEVAIVGCTSTLPHLLHELDGFLPSGSRVRVVLGPDHARGAAMVSAMSDARVRFVAEPRTVAELAHRGEGSICHSDAVVILGHESADDANGDASALATLLRLRRGMRLAGADGLRIVTEVRDPRSAAHIVPRRGDSVVSSDVIAMLLAQEALDPVASDIYREILHPGGAYVSLRPLHELLPPGEHTFGHVLAAARAQGDVALGLYPDPRPRTPSRAAERARLEEGDPESGAEAWLSPPRTRRCPTIPRSGWRCSPAAAGARARRSEVVQRAQGPQRSGLPPATSTRGWRRSWSAVGDRRPPRIDGSEARRSTSAIASRMVGSSSTTIASGLASRRRAKNPSPPVARKSLVSTVSSSSSATSRPSARRSVTRRSPPSQRTSADRPPSDRKLVSRPALSPIIRIRSAPRMRATANRLSNGIAV
jgi:hypothetical protein